MRNVILTNLSALPQNEPKTSFFASDVGEIKGRYTNEAPIKYLMSYIKSSGGNTDLVIAVRTPEAGPAFDKFTEYVTAYAGEIGSPIPELVPVDTSENELESTINRVVNLFAEDDRVFIDTTGGFRNSSYLLMAVVRLLEYAGIGLTKAVYAKYPDEKKIIDITDTYHMFDLINAVNTFSTMGNSCELEKYFSDETNTTVKETIAAMNRFSDELTLCRTSRLNSVLEKLNDKLDELSALDTDSRDIVLLKSLAGMIKKKFRYSGGRIGYPDVVRWCLDNRMIQQAVTIYVEKMPEYFWEKEYFTVSESKFEQIKVQNATKYDDLYYELFYSGLLTELNLPLSTLAKAVSDAAESKKTKKPNGKSGSLTPVPELLMFAFLECPDVDSFLKRTSNKAFSKYEFPKNREGLKRFFQIRNSIYSGSSLREKEVLEKKLLKFPEISAFFPEGKTPFPENPEKFIKYINNNNKLLYAILCPFYNRRYEDSHLCCLEAAATGVSSPDYMLTSKLEHKELQSIFNDIYFAKTFIRNKLNHASEDEVLSDEMKTYFASFGYPVDTEYDVESISRFLYTAIGKLKL